MKSTLKLLGQVTSCIVLITAGGVLAISHAAFEKGDKVWSKHVETALLAEPKPLATAVATVGFAEKLKVKQVQGVWLNVKGDKAEGWIFQGNVAAEKPEIAPAVGMKQVAAADTDTVAAARPLAPAAQGYAERHGAGDAQAGIDWVDAQAALLKHEEVLAWMSQNQLGEYQQGEQP
jgi:hypothetical protein